MAQQQSEIRYLTPPSVDVKKKKYCRFKKSGIKYIDYKDPEFLKKFLNEQGKKLEEKARFIANKTLKEALHGLTLEELRISQEVLRKIFNNTKD
jgi:ribosomal protein S18